MAVLAVQQIVRSGLNPAFAAASAGGNAFPNTGHVFLRVKNANAAVARNITVASQLPPGALPHGAAKTNLAIAFPAQSERRIGRISSCTGLDRGQLECGSKRAKSLLPPDRAPRCLDGGGPLIEARAAGSSSSARPLALVTPFFPTRGSTALSMLRAL